MAWYVMPVHNVAHIHPTLTTGTSDDNYPFSNARTLNHKAVAHLSTVGGLVQLDFDRQGSGASVGIVNTLAIYNSTLGDAGGVVNVYEAVGSSFLSPTTLVNAAPAANNMFYRFDSDSTKRYLRFEWVLNPGDAKIGVMSLGRSYQVAAHGPQILTEQGITQQVASSLPDDDTERVLRSFRMIDRTVAETILTESRSHWVKEGSYIIDGFGGGGNPIIIGEDTNHTLYYGKAQVRIKPWEAAFTELFVDMQQERLSIIA